MANSIQVKDHSKDKLSFQSCWIKIFATMTTGANHYEGLNIRCTNKFPRFFIKNWAFIMKEQNLMFYSKYCPSYCSSCIWHESWSNNASNSPPSYTFILPLHPLSWMSNSPFLNFCNYSLTFSHLRQPHHMFLQAIDAPQLQISSNWRSKSKVPGNDAYLAQNSTFSHTKEYIILIKIH